MPKSKQSIGTRHYNPRSNIYLKRLGKNTKQTDIYETNTISSMNTHTAPIAYTPKNDGHKNKTRIRHAATKVCHEIKRLAQGCRNK